MKADSKPALSELFYFDSVKLVSLDKQNMKGIPNYQIMFNVSYIGLSLSYHKTRQIAMQRSG